MSESDSIRALSADIERFAHERDWEQFHDAKNLAMLMASEVGELVAEYRWVRTEDADGLIAQAEKREAISEEIADVAIALFAFCTRTQLDLATVVRAKLATNAERYPIDLSRGRSQRPGKN